jgi:DNA (cytosine-5)-methyltransferase 1
MRPVGIDLFAGAGGMSLGFEQAGVDVVAAVEIDPIHCAAHKFNFPDCAMIPLSIQKVSGADIRKIAGIGNQPIDVVFGGPPCQGFSMIGQRSMDDPRNELVLDFVRIVRELDTKMFVFENVKGLTVGKQKKFLLEIIEAFDEAGYSVHNKWQVLDAANFGVPQHRERLILFGAKKGHKLPEYPKPTVLPADSKKSDAILPRGPTCKDALGDLSDADEFTTLSHLDSVEAKFGKSSAYSAEMRLQRADDWHFGYKRFWDPNILTSSMRTEHTEISQRRFAETRLGSVEPISRFFKLHPDGLSNTLRAGTDGSRGAFTSPRPIHYRFNRCITVREMARLHGFPDWFRFHITKWHGARQIGNAVPPPLARVVATQVLKALGIQPTRPNRIVKLGDSNLLSVNMSEAATYFNIVKPNNTRNCRSGNKKRKQNETEAARITTMGV